MIDTLTTPSVTPPPGLTGFATHVLAADAPAVVLVDRDLMRGLLQYVAWLEQHQDDGVFW